MDQRVRYDKRDRIAFVTLQPPGKPLDDPLRIEGWNFYTCVDREEARALLQQFYDKVDAGRAGGHPTTL